MLASTTDSLREWASSAACNNDTLKAMTDPTISLCKYTHDKRTLVKVGFDALLLANALKDKHGKDAFLQSLVEA